MQCTVEGCPLPVHVKRLSLCRPHYARRRRYGDPLGGGPMRERDKVRSPRPVQDHDDGTRTCSECKGRKPLSEFPKDKNGTAGHRSHCKPCHSARQTVRYNADPERHRARMRSMRLDHRAEAVRASDRARYERDKPKRLALVTEAGHRRRARLASVASDCGITLKALAARHGTRCCYCWCETDLTPAKGREFRPNKATVEHLDPISRGGTHTWDNVRIACWQCNVDKNAKTYEDWQLSRGVIPLRW